MQRNRVRRKFTVEAKSSGQTRYVSIPSKQPREPQKRIGRTETATLWTSLDAAAAAPQSVAAPVQEHRRILPSLLVADVQELELEPAIKPEELPRARRISRPIEATEGAPRRRGGRRKVIVEQAAEVVDQLAPEPPQAVAETVTAISRRRLDRTGSEKLRLGERWKRRLPSVCW
ncbi:hypothetical protein GCM10008965_45300 [Methylorubrum aminovorans]|nr:hypothetical protein GCM10025880_42840 [Methylorubrum aminovorans]